MDEVEAAPSFTPLEGSIDQAAQAIEALLYPKQTEEKSAPEPAKPESEDEPEAPEAEPSAEVEGAVVEPVKAETPEPPKPEPVAAKAEPVKETKAPEPDPSGPVLTQLNQSILQMQAGIATEFADIKTQADLIRIGQEDPARYNRFVIYQQQLHMAQAEAQRLTNEVQTKWHQEQAQKLATLIPEIADPIKGVALKNDLAAYAAKAGYTPEILQRASAVDVLTLHKAMQYDRMQAAEKAKPAAVEAKIAEAKEKAAKAPPVQKPGVATQNDTPDRVKERSQKFGKTGRLDDLAAFLQEAGI